MVKRLVLLLTICAVLFSVASCGKKARPQPPDEAGAFSIAPFLSTSPLAGAGLPLREALQREGGVGVQ